jgi:RHS repeat-associated protein
VSTWYNWGLGWSVLNEESGTGSGTLQKTYVGGMAELAGSNPATGAYSYYMTDNLGSPRAVYDGSKALAAEFDFGQAYAENDTVGITHRYTGHDWDATANLYFAPYRFYNPQLARWMSRDPLGMVDGPNEYAYVLGRPQSFADLSGLCAAAERSKAEVA